MPMRGELSVPRGERRSVRSDNQELSLIAAFCIFGLTVSLILTAATQSSEQPTIQIVLDTSG